MPRVEVRHMVPVSRRRAGLVLPTGTSEHEVSDEQLEELRGDFRLHVTVLGAPALTPADPAESAPPPGKKK